MSDKEIDKTKIDAAYWAKEFCDRFGTDEIDESLMIGWFANYRFAVSDPLNAKVAELELALQDVSILIDESDGVYGLHHNGDSSPWSELMIEGCYSEWLSNFNDAMQPPLPDIEVC